MSATVDNDTVLRIIRRFVLLLYTITFMTITCLRLLS